MPPSRHDGAQIPTVPAVCQLGCSPQRDTVRIDRRKMLRSMRRAAELGTEGGVATVTNASGLVTSAPPCTALDPEAAVELKDDIDEVRH